MPHLKGGAEHERNPLHVCQATGTITITVEKIQPNAKDPLSHCSEPESSKNNLNEQLRTIAITKRNKGQKVYTQNN